MPSFSNAQVPIRINVKGAKQAVDDFGRIIKSTKNLGKSSKELTKDLQGSNSAMSDLMGAAKGLAAAYVGFNVLKDIVTIGAEFEAQMDRVAAISGATSDQFKKLTDSARELGATTKFTATQVAEGQEYLALAGLKTNQILDAMPGLIALSTASGEDFGHMADIVSDQLSALGLHAGDAGRMADTMAFAMSNANTNVSMLGTAMSYASPIMKTVQQSMEDTVSAIALMSNEGIKGTKAGTALRMGMIRLASDNKRVVETLKELGISISDSSGDFRRITDIFKDLNESTEKLTAADKLQKIAKIFGVEAAPGMITLIKQSKELTQEIEVLGEKTQVTATTFELFSLKQRLAQKEGKQIEEALKITGNSLDTIVEHTARYDEALNTVNASGLSLRATFQQTGQTSNQIISALAILEKQGVSTATSTDLLNNIIAEMIYPSEATANSIAKLGVSLTDSTGGIKDFDLVVSELAISMANMTEQERITALLPLVGNGGREAAQALNLLVLESHGLTQVNQNMAAMTGNAQEMAAVMTENLMGSWKRLVSATQDLSIEIFNSFAPMLTNLTDLFTGAVGGIKEIWIGLSDVFSESFLDSFVSGLDFSAFDDFATAFQDLFSIFDDSSGSFNILHETLELIGSGLALVTNLAIDFTTGFLEGITPLIDSFDSLLNALSPLFDGIGDIISLFVDFGDSSEGIVDSLEILGNVLGFVLTAQLKLVVDSLTLIINTLSSLGKWLGETAAHVVHLVDNLGLLGAIKQMWQDVINYLTSIDLTAVGKKIIGTLVGGIKSMHQSLVSSVADIFMSIDNKLFPHSDAKEGGFSNLTGAGAAIMSTMAMGVSSNGKVLNEAVKKNFEAVQREVESLEKSAFSVGKTREELKLFEMAANGASTATLEYAQSLQQQIMYTEELEKAEKKFQEIGLDRHQILALKMQEMGIDEQRIAQVYELNKAVELQTALSKKNKELDKQLAYAGLTNYEKEIEALRLKGATEEELNEILEKRTRILEKQAEVKGVKTIENLEEEIALLGLSNEERKKAQFVARNTTEHTNELQRQQIELLYEEREAVKENNKVWSEVGKHTTSFFENVMSGAKSGKEAFKDFTSSIKDMWFKSMAEMAQKQLSELLTGTGKGGGLFGGIADAIGGLFGGGDSKGGGIMDTITKGIGSLFGGGDGPGIMDTVTKGIGSLVGGMDFGSIAKSVGSFFTGSSGASSEITKTVTSAISGAGSLAGGLGGLGGLVDSIGGAGNALGALSAGMSLLEGDTDGAIRGVASLAASLTPLGPLGGMAANMALDFAGLGAEWIEESRNIGGAINGLTGDFKMFIRETKEGFVGGGARVRTEELDEGTSDQLQGVLDVVGSTINGISDLISTDLVTSLDDFSAFIGKTHEDTVQFEQFLSHQTGKMIKNAINSINIVGIDTEVLPRIKGQISDVIGKVTSGTFDDASNAEFWSGKYTTTHSTRIRDAVKTGLSNFITDTDFSELNTEEINQSLTQEISKLFTGLNVQLPQSTFETLGESIGNQLSQVNDFLKTGVGGISDDNRFVKAFRDMSNRIDVFAFEDANNAIKAFTDLSNQMFSLKSAFETAGLSANMITTHLIDSSGGFENLGVNIKNFSDKFVPQAVKEVRQLETATNNVGSTFKELGLEIPKTRDGFRLMVEGIDTVNKSGADQFNTLISLSNAMDIYYTDLEKQETAIQDNSNAIQTASEGLNQFYNILIENFGDISKIINVSGVTNALNDAINNATDAESAGQAFAQNITNQIQQGLVNAAIGSISQIIMQSVISPMVTSTQQRMAMEIQSSTIASQNTISASTVAAQNDISASATSSVALTNGGANAATQLETGGANAGILMQNALSEEKRSVRERVISQAREQIALTVDIIQDPEIKAMLADLTPSLESMGEAAFGLRNFVTSSQQQAQQTQTQTQEPFQDFGVQSVQAVETVVHSLGYFSEEMNNLAAQIEENNKIFTDQEQTLLQVQRSYEGYATENLEIVDNIQKTWGISGRPKLESVFTEVPNLIQGFFTEFSNSSDMLAFLTSETFTSFKGSLHAQNEAIEEVKRFDIQFRDQLIDIANAQQFFARGFTGGRYGTGEFTSYGQTITREQSVTPEAQMIFLDLETLEQDFYNYYEAFKAVENDILTARSNLLSDIETDYAKELEKLGNSLRTFDTTQLSDAQLQARNEFTENFLDTISVLNSTDAIRYIDEFVLQMTPMELVEFSNEIGMSYQTLLGFSSEYIDILKEQEQAEKEAAQTLKSFTREIDTRLGRDLLPDIELPDGLDLSEILQFDRQTMLEWADDLIKAGNIQEKALELGFESTEAFTSAVLQVIDAAEEGVKPLNDFSSILTEIESRLLDLSDLDLAVLNFEDKLADEWKGKIDYAALAEMFSPRDLLLKLQEITQSGELTDIALQFGFENANEFTESIFKIADAWQEVEEQLTESVKLLRNTIGGQLGYDDLDIMRYNVPEFELLHNSLQNLGSDFETTARKILTFDAKEIEVYAEAVGLSVEQVTDYTEKFLDKSKQLQDEFNDALLGFNEFVLTSQGLSDMEIMQELVPAFNQVRDVLVGLGDDFDSVVAQIQGFSPEEIQAYAESVGLSAQQLFEFTQSYLDETFQLTEETGEAFGKLNDEMRESIQGLRNFILESKGLSQSEILRQNNPLFKRLHKDLSNLGSDFDGITDAILGFSDEEIKAYADVVGLTVDELTDYTQTYLEEQFELQEELHEAEIEHKEKLIDYMKQLNQFGKDLLMDENLSILKDVPKLEIAQADYNDILQRAMAGEEDALEQYESVARKFLEQSREVNASTDAYTQDFNRVQSDIASITGKFGDITITPEERTAQFQDDMLEGIELLTDSERENTLDIIDAINDISIEPVVPITPVTPVINQGEIEATRTAKAIDIKPAATENVIQNTSATSLDMPRGDVYGATPNYTWKNESSSGAVLNDAKFDEVRALLTELAPQFDDPMAAYLDYKRSNLADLKLYAESVGLSLKEVDLFARNFLENFANIPSYDVGTDYVPNNSLAMVHKGEIIIPAAQSNLLRSGKSSMETGITLNEFQNNRNNRPQNNQNLDTKELERKLDAIIQVLESRNNESPNETNAIVTAVNSLDQRITKPLKGSLDRMAANQRNSTRQRS